MPIVEVEKLEMSFPGPDGMPVPIIGIDKWEMREGARAALVGPSGSGKTTFLHLLAGIRRPTRGVIRVDGRDITALSESSRDEWRSTAVGYVFQQYYLFPALTVLENTVLPLTFSGCPAHDRQERAMQILNQLEMDHRCSFYPHQLSTGEKQRAVIARALINRPRIVLADEPSANLDGHRRRLFMELLQKTADRQGSTLLVATHDLELASLFPVRLEMEQFK